MLEELLKTTGVDLEIGQIIVDTRDQLSLADFEAICREHPDLNLEQKASGELVIMSPHGARSSNVSMEIGHQLKAWAKRSRFGKVFDSNALFLLPDGSKLSPDVSLLSADKWGRFTPSEQDGFLPIVPDFIVEVRSPSDRLKTLQIKMEDWMRNGVALGWLIDVKAKKAWRYSASGVEEHSLLEDFAGSGPVEGFALSVQELYDSLD